MNEEQRAIQELVPIIRELMNSARVMFVLQSHDLGDVPGGFFAVSEALRIVSEEEYELGTK